MRIAITLATVIACSKGSTGAPPPSGSATPQAPPAKLHAIAKLASPRLVIGSRRVGIEVGDDGWLEPALPAPRAHPEMAQRIATARQKLGGDFRVFLGAYPIATGGDEHHESVVRLEPQPRTIALDGGLVRVATLRSGIEMWQYDVRLRATLAVVDAAGVVTPQPPFPLIGPPAERISPVGTMACATPRIQELATTDDEILALLSECNLDAPLRIATYRWPAKGDPKPTVTIERLASPNQLGFEPVHFVVSRDGARALVGVANGSLAVARFTSGNQVTMHSSLSGVALIAGVVFADDGALWTLTMSGGANHHDSWQVARDDEIVPVADSSGKPLEPTQLAFDERYGVVVIAGIRGDSWLLAERGAL